MSDKVESTETLLQAILSTDPKEKFGAVKELRELSAEDPQHLYHHFDFFVGLLESKNNIIKWNAMDILANLAAVDSENKFERIFAKVLGFLDEGSLITAAHVVENAAKIVRAKPALEPETTQKLLGVGEIKLPTAECTNIIKGKAIVAFGNYFDQASKKAEIVSFAKKEVTNSRNATKLKAEKFLQKYGS